MKKYIKPKTENICIITESMLASSPGLNNTMGDTHHFSNERKIWSNSIWNSEE